MARKTATVTISAEGRDKGKTFFLTEMSAERSEEWGERALLALVRGGGQQFNGFDVQRVHGGKG